jgi:hypothetical protein
MKRSSLARLARPNVGRRASAAAAAKKQEHPQWKNRAIA